MEYVIMAANAAALSVFIGLHMELYKVMKRAAVKVFHDVKKHF